MFCGKCGNKLDDSAKFCGKCGTKVNKQTSNANVNNLNSFIGNIVKKSEEQSPDKDIFNKLEEDIYKKPYKKSYKKSYTKSKKKNKSKPRKKKKKTVHTKKKHIKLNIKLIIFIIVIVLLVLAGIGSFIFIKYGDDLFAANYVKSSISKTFKEFDKYSDKTDAIPNLLLRENPKNKLTEREMYLEIKDAQGGLANENILGSLKGLSIKTDEKYNAEKDLFNTKLTFANSKKEEMNGEIFSSPSVYTLSIPDLYSDTLGINLNDNDDTIVNSQYYTKLSDVVELLSDYESTYADCKTTLKDKFENLITNIFANCEYKIESKDKETNLRVYNTIVDNKYMLESLKTLLTDSKEDSNINKMLSFILYFVEGNSLQASETAATEKIDTFITNIDNAIESNKVEDVELKLAINEDKVINNIVFNTIIDGVGVSVNIDLANEEKTFDYKASVKLSKDDSFLNLDITSLIKDVDDNKINRQNIFTFSTSLDDKITLSFNEDYNLENYDYNNNIDFVVDSAFENLSIAYKLNGNYQIEKSLDKLNIDNLKLNITTDLYKFNFDFKGYVQQQESDLVEETNLDNVIFINNMSDEEIDKIKSEIKENGLEFLDQFEKGKW